MGVGNEAKKEADNILIRTCLVFYECIEEDTVSIWHWHGTKY
jgi:hypothetical protein